MGSLLHRAGQLVGILGILLMLISVGGRLAGNYWLGGFATGTLMVAGIGAVTVACFLLLCVMADRRA